jgi:hypothetical protein
VQDAFDGGFAFVDFVSAFGVAGGERRVASMRAFFLWRRERSSSLTNCARTGGWKAIATSLSLLRSLSFVATACARGLYSGAAPRLSRRLHPPQVWVREREILAKYFFSRTWLSEIGASAGCAGQMPALPEIYPISFYDSLLHIINLICF